MSRLPPYGLGCSAMVRRDEPPAATGIRNSRARRRQCGLGRDEDGVVRPGPNDLEHKVGDLVKLVLADDGSVLRVLDT